MRAYIRGTVGLIALIVVGGCNTAESSDQPGDERPAAEQAATLSVAAGTSVQLTLDQTISTKSAMAGHSFEATVRNDVVSADGTILIPAGSKAQGVVTAASESPGADDPAILALQMKSLSIGGRSYAIESTIVDAAMKADTRDSTGESVAKIAVGTAAGALAGRVLGGDRKDAVVGAAAGAVAGTVLAITTKDGHAEISNGSTLTIRFDQALSLR